MPTLTDTQLIVLSKAAAREGGVAVAPRGLSDGALGQRLRAARGEAIAMG
jgi:hypothetical protein